MDTQSLQYYLDKNTLGLLSQEEWTTLRLLLRQPENQRLLAAYLDQQLEETSGEDIYYPGVTNEVLSQVLLSIKQNRYHNQVIHRVHFWRKWSWAAASLLLLLGAGSYYFLTKPAGKTDDVAFVSVAADVPAPQSTKARITLADGRTVSLNHIASGVLARQSEVTVTKTAAGQIVYAGKATENVYNTLTNPRGSRVIDMTLADGSRVWLNAGSSVTYPVAFAGQERKVIVSGEAYFEVFPDKTKPFTVSKGAMEVEVLGTHFNVNAYDEETDMKVTLLEGAVKVSRGLSESLLKPGEQAQVTNTVKVVSEVDLEQVMAWKNGAFSFARTDLSALMRQIARWYDVEVVYAGAVPQGRFTGEIDNTLTLDQLLKGLSKTIHYRIENGNKIIILPE